MSCTKCYSFQFAPKVTLKYDSSQVTVISIVLDFLMVQFLSGLGSHNLESSRLKRSIVWYILVSLVLQQNC